MAIIKDDVCMMFCSEKEPLFLETDASGMGIEAGLLQARDCLSFQWDEMPDNSALCHIAFACKSLTSAEQDTTYKGEHSISLCFLGILHVYKFHHYCFTHKVSVIIDHNPFMAIFKKHVATLSQKLQLTLLCIHQYRICILYKQGPQLYIVDWLTSHNHTEGKDREITGMKPEPKCSWNIHSHSIMHEGRINQACNAGRWSLKHVNSVHDKWLTANHS